MTPVADTRIEELTLEQIMGDRFGRYSKSIVQERALPDIRDGLKPVQRRILFAMNKDGNTYDKGFRKSAKSVGNVMGNFHPHGDSSIYEALVRLSQDWKLREPLIEMHGNNGSMDGDPAAAMRYTEARLSKIAGRMLEDIDKDTVEMTLNFDDTEKEPVVLPARIPNLFVNGATGISAGYATEIPTHNLGELIDALIYLLAHPAASLDDLMKFVPGPDFPTGAIIQGKDGIKKAYETGRGRVVVRAKTSIETLRGGREQIVVTEIPYEVNKAQLMKRITDLRLNKKVEGIADARDETDRTGLRIAIELKRGVDAQGVLNYLLKNTDLQINYNFNMVAINDQRPVRVGLKHYLASYLAFQKEVITRRTRFDLRRPPHRRRFNQGPVDFRPGDCDHPGLQEPQGRPAKLGGGLRLYPDAGRSDCRLATLPVDQHRRYRLRTRASQVNRANRKLQADPDGRKNLGPGLETGDAGDQKGICQPTADPDRGHRPKVDC